MFSLLPFKNGHCSTPGPAIPGIGRIAMAGCFHDSSSVTLGRDFPWYALVLTFAGEGSYSIDSGETGHMLQGDLLLLRPGLRHRFGPLPERNWSECFIAFGGPIFDPMMGPRGLHPALHLISLVDWESYAERMLTIMCSTGTAGKRLGDLVALLGNLVDQHERNERLSAKEWIELVDDKLYEQSCVEFSGQQLSVDMGMPYESIRKRYHHACGCSPRETHTRLGMTRAIQLLESMSIAQVSDALGYCDQFQFSKQFKKDLGQAPSYFKKR